MNLVAMMSFFDEDPILIKRSVRGLARLCVTRIVACDGRYDLFPGSEINSSLEQIDVLRQACIERRVTLDLHQPDDAWAGNEVEKRQFMLDRATDLAYQDDWLVIWDCDYRLIDGMPPSWIEDELSATDRDVATISFTEDKNALMNSDFYPMAMFLRAQQGIAMDGNHHTYLLPDGRRSQVLRRSVENQAEVLHLPEIKVLHDVHQRPIARRALQAAYYAERDEMGIES